MASIRPVGVLGSAVGHAALRMSSACAVAALSSSSTARWASFGSRLRDPLDRPIRQPGGLAAAKVGADAAAAGNAPNSGAAATLTAASVTAVIAVRRSDRGVGATVALGVGPEHAVVEIVVGVRPEGVIRIRVERVVDEVVVGVRPEQRANPADDDRERTMPSPLRVEEPALERRARQGARVGIAGGG